MKLGTIKIFVFFIVLQQLPAVELMLSANDYSEPIILKVDKKALFAELGTWPEFGKEAKLIHRFKIAIGKAEGDKEREGDNKTPEGIYFTQNIIADPGVPEKYGPRAIPLDFPNPLDKLARKTGYGIWLHGAGNDQRIEASNVTEGCVAFYNSDILKLTDWLRPHQAIVMIAPDLQLVNKTDDIQALKDATESWLSAWSNRKIEDYISHYAEDFENKGMNKKSYRDYKHNVFSSYKEIQLVSHQIRYATHPKYAMSIMNQDFKGDKRFSSSGRKILYWTKDNNNQWKIVKELFEERRFEALSFNEGQVAALAQSQKPSNM